MGSIMRLSNRELPIGSMILFFRREELIGSIILFSSSMFSALALKEIAIPSVKCKDQ
jgi:hypothetical protein